MTMTDKPTIEQIIAQTVAMGASDVHITVMRPPIFRVNGTLLTSPDLPKLTPADTEALAHQIMTHERHRQILAEEGQVDFSNSFAGFGRVRVNVFNQRGSVAIAIRIIPMEVPRLEDLGLPSTAQTLPLQGSGLLLVTGPTGSGKSTTLAAMINLLNQKVYRNILTLEDPIEFLHRHNKCMINQREIGTDCISFAQGLRSALRQDPDIILVGEMRDLETIATAITAAETGHLVMATLHSATAVQTIARIIDVFPPHQQGQIRVQLANTLLGIISQQLVPKRDGSGRVVSCEVLVNNPAIRNLIRENKTHQINTVIQTGSALGMVTMERSLKDFLRRGVIDQEEVQRRLSNS